MSTNPKSLHDAMRQLLSLLGCAEREVDQYIGGDDGRYDDLRHVVEYLREAQRTVHWVRDTYKNGEKRNA